MSNLLSGNGCVSLLFNGGIIWTSTKSQYICASFLRYIVRPPRQSVQYGSPLFIVVVFSLILVVCMICTPVLKSVSGPGCDEYRSYVFSMEGASCTVTTVEPLAVLCCSALLWSTLATRGMRKLSSDGTGDCTKLPDTELGPRWLIRTFVCVVDGDFLRALEPPTPFSILDACVFLWNGGEEGDSFLHLSPTMMLDCKANFPLLCKNCELNTFLTKELKLEL